MLPDQIISAIRVGVAAFVGWLLVNVSLWLGVTIPDELGEALKQAAVSFASGLVAVLYYLIIRVVAKKFPWVESFLGYKASPVMVKTSNVEKAKSMTKHL